MRGVWRTARRASEYTRVFFRTWPRQASSSSKLAAVPDLCLRDLRDVALLCGRNTMGTKAALRTDLQTAVAAAGTGLASCRVLSIDMGVRNLAYCLLHVGRRGAVPKLVAWERLSLIDGTADEDGADASPSPFSPPAMAAVAARLVYDRLLPLEPSHVIIERQRFRSGGAAAVLEWTVRVNSLEAMLHGIFAARQLAHEASGATADKSALQSVQAISPRRVSQFVVRGGLASTAAPSKATKEKDIKDVKEALMAGILRRADGKSRQLLTYDNTGHVGDMVEAFLSRWDAKQRKSRSKANPAEPAKMKLTKIDDLADCVAQGLTWLEWDRNMRLLCTKGAEAVLAASQLHE